MTIRIDPRHARIMRNAVAAGTARAQQTINQIRENHGNHRHESIGAGGHLPTQLPVASAAGQEREGRPWTRQDKQSSRGCGSWR